MSGARIVDATVFRAIQKSSSMRGVTWSISGSGSTIGVPEGAQVCVMNTFGRFPPNLRSGILEDGEVTASGKFAFSFGGLMSDWSGGDIWIVIKDGDKELCDLRVKVQPASGVGSGGDEDDDDSCFFSTSAGSSDLKDGLHYAEALRNEVKRKTRWGADFDAAMDQTFSRISPVIAKTARSDPRMAHVIDWALTRPVLGHLRLATARPKDWTFREDNKELAEFIDIARTIFDAWANSLHISDDFRGLEPSEIVTEICTTLTLVRPDQSDAYLSQLEKAGTIPVKADGREAHAMTEYLTASGLADDQTQRIMGSETRRG